MDVTHLRMLAELTEPLGAKLEMLVGCGARMIAWIAAATTVLGFAPGVWLGRVGGLSREASRQDSGATALRFTVSTIRDCSVQRAPS